MSLSTKVLFFCFSLLLLLLLASNFSILLENLLKNIEIQVFSDVENTTARRKKNYFDTKRHNFSLSLLSFPFNQDNWIIIIFQNTCQKNYIYVSWGFTIMISKLLSQVLHLQFLKIEHFYHKYHIYSCNQKIFIHLSIWFNVKLAVPETKHRVIGKFNSLFIYSIYCWISRSQYQSLRALQ